MYGSSSCQTYIHRPGRKSIWKGVFFQILFYLMYIPFVIWVTMYACRQSCPGALWTFLKAAVFGRRHLSGKGSAADFTDSPIKVRVREPVVKSGMNKCVCADMCSEREVLWPPSMGRERNICFCSKCVFMISDTGNDSGFILTALWRSCQVFPQLFPPGSS